MDDLLPILALIDNEKMKNDLDEKINI